MKYREIKNKKDKLWKEIEVLIKSRNDNDNMELNSKIEKKKKEYKFYCGLLKNFEVLKSRKGE